MTTTIAAPVRVEAVTAALATVRDPELDEPITDLRFVAVIRVKGGRVEVDLRLPTYFCAPNFAYLMVADAYDAVAQIDGVEQARIRLLDHFASEEINSGVAAGSGFAGTFPGLATGEPAALRTTFRRKAHAAAQERVAAGLQRSGWGLDRLATATLGDAPPSAERERLVRRRLELGLPAEDDAPLLVGPDGMPVPVEALPTHLRFARTTRVSIEGNSGFCRGLLRVRYDLDEQPFVTDRQ
jgi:metal-sulfur cluster biosynthetic enzyme